MDRLGHAVYRCAAWLLGLLPIRAVFRLGWAFGWLGYYIAAPYRRLVLRNLQIAFGSEKTAGELRKLAREHFATLGANLFSSLRIPQLSKEEICALVEHGGLERVAAGAAAKRGLVMPISHFGNWELFAQLSPLLFGCPVGAIYQALGNPLIDAEIRRNRAALGLALFERREGFTSAIQHVRKGGAVGILIDQHAGDAGIWTPFFGRLASTSTLAATLAQRTGALVVPAAVYTVGIARWRMEILPSIDVDGTDAAALTVRLNAALEAQIRRQPADWFWVHNRWKTPKPKFLLATYKRGAALPESGAGALQPFRILVRAPNWLGDAVMSVPAVRAIKCGRPDAHVTVLTVAKLADFWKETPEVDEVLTIEPEDSVFKVARKLRGRGFEAAVLFPNSFRAALEAWLAGIPRRVGRPGHRRSWLLDQVFRGKKKKAPRPPQHQVHQDLELAEFIGADITGATQFPPRAAEGNGDRCVIGLCPGAEYGPAKRWLPERFAEVMHTVSAARACEWKLFGVAKDRAVADQVLAAAGVPATDLVGKTTLAELMAELRTCDVLLTNDTGAMHLAAFLGVPVVAVFGSTEPALTGPLGKSHRVIRHHVECSPCFLRECPIDFRCMHAVTADEVSAAVLKLLASNRTDSASVLS